MNTARHALTLEQVRIFLAERELLHIEATIAPGDVLTVMEPSGSGKSTLLALLAGFLAAPFRAEGRLWLGERELSPPASRAAWHRPAVSGPAAVPPP